MTRTIQKTSENQTVGGFLKRSLSLSRRIIIKLKKTDGIEVNGSAVHTNFVLHEGDVLTVSLPEEQSETLKPENIPINVLYEDEHLLAVNKPKNMAVHPTLNYKSGTLANAALHYFKGEPFVFRPVNRLDKDTSGVVLIAKNQIAASRLSAQLAQKEMQKTYFAIVFGVPQPSVGKISAPIALEEGSIIKRCINPSGASAETEYETIRTNGSLSLVRLFPHTGRTHQIRVHMAHIGCPLYADFLYGTEIPDETFYLHCASLSFMHPITQKQMTVHAPLPDCFKERIDK